MRLEITFIVDNEEWSDEEYEEKSERTVILETCDIVNAVERLVQLNPGESIEDIYKAQEVNKS